MRDPALVDYLREQQLPLDVSPTSNLCTRSVSSLEEHPLPYMLDAGLLVTLNSDDPPMFGTTLTDEYLVAAELLGLDESGVVDLARAAVDASFAPADVRAGLHRELDGVG